MNEIYDFCVSRGKLTQEHHIELKEKRGFTNETITRNKFFSGGQYFLGLENELLEKFKPEDLVASGVCLRKGTSIHIDPILLDDRRVIIPYLDSEGQCTLLRPHKLGLRNIPIQIYQPFNISTEKNKGGIIITEGEFKACAGWQWGANCIALPGVGSYSGREKYADLIEFLNKHEIKNICIVFDNEIKDDPQYPNYKPDVNDRYDTVYYAFIMAKMLNKDGFETTIGTLPDSWRVS